MKYSPLVSSIFGLFLASPTLRAVEESHGSGAATEGIAPASDEGRNAIKTFRFDAGLKCELWAAEPLVANPVAFSQDAQGRWFVAETFRQEKGVEDDRAHLDWLDADLASKSTDDRLAMMHRFYPDAAKFTEKFTHYEDRIVRLEDHAGGGFADQTTIFAAGFRDPLDGTGAGVLARGSELWYTCIPNLWHFRDSNDDGVADEQEKLLSGFGIKFALRGHDMHGLRFGPDGKLYFSIGDRALNVRTKEGTDLANYDSGSILRCDPDGSHFEIFATGVRNPQELAFDAHGNLFTCDNNSDAGDGARFTYLVEGGDCGWRMAYQYLSDRGPWMQERPWDEKIASSFRYLVPCILNVSAGPSGFTYNSGTGLSAKYQDKFYLSDFRGGATNSVVHEISTQPKGAFFTATHRDVVKGILTTDVEFGNDGSLYVLDWVTSWVGVGKGRIYKFTDANADTMIQKATEKLIAEGMVKRPEEELSALLGHADQRVRQAAQFELTGRGVASVQVFATVAGNKTTNPLARLHAIWGLGQLAKKNDGALALLLPLLADPDLEVRAQSAKVLGDAKAATAAPKFVALLQDPENRVRFFAALGLGKIGYPTAFEPLCAMLAENADADPILRHGGVMGLVGCATPEQIASKASDPSVAVRGAAVVALRRLTSPLVVAFLQDVDEGVVLEAARAIYDVPITPVLPALGALTANSAVKNPFILTRAINAHYRLGTADNTRALAAFAADSSEPENLRKDALAALADWATPDAKDRLLNSWRPLPDRNNQDAVTAATPLVSGLLNDSSAVVQAATAKLAGQLALTTAGEPLGRLATNPKASEPARLEALRALASLKDANLLQVAKAVATDPSSRIRSEGFQALAKADPTTAVQMIDKIVSTGTTAEQQGALRALGQIKSPAADAVLLSLLEQLALNTIPAEIQLDVIEAARKHPTPELKARLVRYESAFPPTDDLAKWRFALSGGDEVRGRKIFREKAETQCQRCHVCEVGDSLVGPELTHIAATKDRAYLLESIVYPNKKIATGFETVMLTLTDGSMVAGRLTSQDDVTLKVETADAQGKPQTVTVPLSQISQRASAPSPMPPNLAELLSPTELRDLVEYLANRK